MPQYPALLIRRSIWKFFHDQSNERKNHVMKTIKGIPAWALILIFLLLVNLIWMFWNLHQNGGFRAAVAANRFKVEALHTNDLSGIGIFERQTEQPLWTEWNFSHEGKPEMENYFFQGKDVFDIALSSNHPPRYTVFFPGPEKSGTWWLDRGGAESFTERIFYETNGAPSKHEVWYANTWYPVDRRNEKNGIVINRQWHQLSFDTNGMWTTEAPTMESTNHF